MTEDMQRRGLARATQQAYLPYVEQRAVFTVKSPDLVTGEEFRQPTLTAGWLRTHAGDPSRRRQRARPAPEAIASRAVRPPSDRAHEALCRPSDVATRQ